VVFQGRSFFVGLLFFLSSFPVSAAITQWTDLGGAITGKVAVGKNADGRLEAFARWQDNTLHHSYQTSPGSSQWSTWSSLGGTLTSNPVVASNPDGTLDVFVLSSNTAVWHIKQAAPNSTSWTGWTSLGGSGWNDPAVGVNADGRLEVFIETTNYGLWHNWQTSPGGAWAGGASIGGSLVAGPSAGPNSDGRVMVFTGDTDGKYWWIIQNSVGDTSYSSWFCLLGGTVSAPVVAKNSDGSLALFAVRADGSVWTSSQAGAGSYNWTDWTSLGGSVTGTPAVAADKNGALEVFVHGTDNALWYSAQSGPGGAWSNWTSLGSTLQGDPYAAVDSNGLIQVFAEGSDGGMWNIGQSSPGAWSSPAAVPQISSSNTLVPVWRGTTNFSSNMYVSIYGSNLATTTQSWNSAFSGSNAPTKLGGASVTINNIPAYIQYVSPTQININAPDDATTGPVNIVVTNSAGTSNIGKATRSEVSPTLLSMPQFSVGNTYYVVAETPDFGTFIGPSILLQGARFEAASPGSIVVIYATGCGPTNPPTQAGVLAAQNSPLALPYQVTIGGMPANVLFAGMVAGTVGLYQFNVVIPNVPAGDQPIQLTVNGVSNAQNLMITIGH
jgi:uncharacterized protein (TIGR03437 family)